MLGVPVMFGIPVIGSVDVATAVVFVLVEPLDGGLGLGVAVHLHEAEALGAVRLPIDDDLGRLDRAMRLE